jgi:SAM-dependent methyltransferase
MAGRARVEPAGDFDYEAGGGRGYARRRRTDPRIAEYVHAALGDAETVLNVGAGAGSYEPEDRYVVAVEPSAAMRAQRTLRPAVDAVAERLPFDDGAFAAAMATITIHQWSDVGAGLRELRRVSRGPVVLLTFDGGAMLDFWLHEYAPEMLEVEAARFPELDVITAALGKVTVTPVPIPFDCVDGFAEAFYGRPEELLDADVRRSQSAWANAGEEATEVGVARLREALSSGAWDEKHGALRSEPEYLGSLRLITAAAR